MKYFKIFVLIIPFLSFGQISDKEKSQIESYATEFCDCANSFFDQLHPKALDLIVYLMENGQKDAQEYLKNQLAEMDDKEQAEFIASFQKMQDPDYLGKVEACDNSKSISADFKERVDDFQSDSHKYLMEFLDREASCKMVKFFYDLGKRGSFKE